MKPSTSAGIEKYEKRWELSFVTEYNIASTLTGFMGVILTLFIGGLLGTDILDGAFVGLKIYIGTLLVLMLAIVFYSIYTIFSRAENQRKIFWEETAFQYMKLEGINHVKLEDGIRTIEDVFSTMQDLNNQDNVFSRRYKTSLRWIGILATIILFAGLASNIIT